jgi:hypothetical protein
VRTRASGPLERWLVPSIFEPCHRHGFFRWYNVEHHHSGLGLLTPHAVHQGLAEHRVAARATVLAAAYAAHPERFSGGLPQPPARPVEVWINRPTRATECYTNSREPAISFHAGSSLLDPQRVSG